MTRIAISEESLDLEKFFLELEMLQGGSELDAGETSDLVYAGLMIFILSIFFID